MSTLTLCCFADLCSFRLVATECFWLRADHIMPFNTDFSSAYSITSAALKPSLSSSIKPHHISKPQSLQLLSSAAPSQSDTPFLVTADANAASLIMFVFPVENAFSASYAGQLGN